MTRLAISGVAVVPPLLRRQSFGTYGAFRGSYMRRAYFSGGVGCDVVMSAPSPVCSKPCSTYVVDIASGHVRQDGRYFASTQSHS